MAAISGYDSNSISTLFSGLNSSRKSGATDLLGISYTDYATIKGGSYFKLMKAYYSDSDASKAITSTATSKDDTKTLAQIEDATDSLKNAADALLEKGSKSVFNKVSVKDESGKTSQQYDTDAIYKKVSNFVDSYNSVVSKTADANTTGILTSVSSMVNTTKANSAMLSKLGITIGSDNKLSIDETTFKKADMNTVKSMFNGQGSYGYAVSAKASMANYYAENEASKANTYAKSGMYTYNYSTGDIYNTTT